MFRPLWIENRETQSGESITVLGSQPIGMFHGHDFGKRKKHDVWEDTEVINFVVAHLYIYRRVVVLSENLRKDPNGLRRLLSRDVGPVLNGTTDHLLSLVTLFRRGGTPIPSYCDKVRDFLEAGSYSVGYREERF